MGERLRDRPGPGGPGPQGEAFDDAARGPGLEGEPQQARHRSGLRQWHGGGERALVSAPTREPADPLEAVGREPARAEAPAELRGPLAQTPPYPLPGLRPPLALHRL